MRRECCRGKTKAKYSIFPGLFFFSFFLYGCLAPIRTVVHQQRTEATHYDGPRCPMYPSCSAWGDRAITEYGWLGLLLTVDRLFFRESGALGEKYILAPLRMSRSPRYYDPLEDSLGTSKPDLFYDSF